MELPAAFKKLVLNEMESSATFQLFENPQRLFKVDTDLVLPFEGMKYTKKQEKTPRFVVRGMECDVKHKVLFCF